MCAPCRLYPLNDFVAQPINRRLLGFKIQTKKSSRWFWGVNHQTVAVGFEVQIGKPSTTGFEGKSGETVTTGFEAKSEKTIVTGLDAKPEKTISVILMPNHWQIIPVVLTPNHWQTSRSPSHQVPDLCDHLRSSALGLLLLPLSSSLPAMPHRSSKRRENRKSQQNTRKAANQAKWQRKAQNWKTQNSP
jgi:hypothetical protein